MVKFRLGKLFNLTQLSLLSNLLQLMSFLEVEQVLERIYISLASSHSKKISVAGELKRRNIHYFSRTVFFLFNRTRTKLNHVLAYFFLSDLKSDVACFAAGTWSSCAVCKDAHAQKHWVWTSLNYLSVQDLQIPSMCNIVV